MNDLGDQLERVLGAESEPDERNIGMLPCGDSADLCDLYLPRDHLMAEAGDDLGEQLEPVPALVGDQDAML